MAVYYIHFMVAGVNPQVDPIADLHIISTPLAFFGLFPYVRSPR